MDNNINNSDNSVSNNDTPSSREIVTALSKRVDEVIELLRSQQEILRRRGMNLPSGSVDSLRKLKSRMETLSRSLGGNQKELRTFRALAETTALITSTLDTSEVLNQVMDTVVELTGAERGYIVLKNRETGELDEFRVARGIDRDALATQTTDETTDKKEGYIVSRSIVNSVAESGEPILADNATDDARFADAVSVAGFNLRSILAIPLSVRGELIGVVYCDNRIQKGLFSKTELELLTAFSNQAAVAIDNARLFEEARRHLADVTEMRDLMENIFESITSGVVTTDERGIITQHNIAASQIIGQGELKEKALRDVLPEMGDLFYEKLDTVIANNEVILLETEPVLNGEKRYWNITASILNAVQGQGTGLALVIDDLTEQKKHEAQLAEVKRYLPTALVRNLRDIDMANVGGEEREITAIFADVRGFTSFSENLQPEELMRIINKYLSVASDAINLYEGIVDKYMGDAVTGLFNTQLNPQEDHAMRAVSASVSILYDLYALHEVLPEEQRLFFGIGIHTGMSVLGNVGGRDRKEFAALGEATDLSKVLQESAKSNIVVSPQTYEYIKDAFECELIPLKKTKGDLTHGYVVGKRKKGTQTTNMLLADLLSDFDD